MPLERSTKAPNFGGSDWVFYPVRQTRSQAREFGARKSYAGDEDSSSDDRDFMIARPLKQREICSPEQKLALEQLYEQTNGYPTTAQRLALCAQIGKYVDIRVPHSFVICHSGSACPFPLRVITVYCSRGPMSPESTYTWFQNKRNSAKEKKRRLISGGGPARARTGSEEAMTPGPATPASQKTSFSSNESIGTSHAGSFDGSLDTALRISRMNASPTSPEVGHSSPQINNISNLEEHELCVARILAGLPPRQRQEHSSQQRASTTSNSDLLGLSAVAANPEAASGSNSMILDVQMQGFHQQSPKTAHSFNLQHIGESNSSNPQTNVASEPLIFRSCGYLFTASELEAIRSLCQSKDAPVNF
ncbi:hypothetical protein FRC15_005058 [Serendipita sp. 397]|nr:hypothetical protein FRC15_005058 [Serendipita sp. 397]